MEFVNVAKELVLVVTSDLRKKRLQVRDLEALKMVLKKADHVPGPDVQPVIGALMSQRVIKVDKSGQVALV